MLDQAGNSGGRFSAGKRARGLDGAAGKILCARTTDGVKSFQGESQAVEMNVADGAFLVRYVFREQFANCLRGFLLRLGKRRHVGRRRREVLPKQEMRDPEPALDGARSLARR